MAGSLRGVASLCKEAPKHCEGHWGLSLPTRMLPHGAEASGAAGGAPRPPSPLPRVPGMRLDRRPHRGLGRGSWTECLEGSSRP